MEIVDWVPDILFFPLSSGLEFFWNVFSGRKKLCAHENVIFLAGRPLRPFLEEQET